MAHLRKKMPQESMSGQEPDDSEAEFVEVDPSARYGRYKEVLGKGAFKKVYRAFDELEGIEVAWNQVKTADLLRNSEGLDRLYSEVHLLETLRHKNIIKFYNWWVDTKNENINFITEIFTSGTLRQYRTKHKHVDLRALKKWSRQILEGLSYLHSHDPPVIHRDLKCDNIFVNGNQGEVKIGDLGLAAILLHCRSAHTVIGTPEFMAPELYEEEYNELVDIYAFGMCLLELVTFEYPYVECANAAQIYKKVTSGIKPASLAKVKNPSVRAFIEKCISKVSDRLPAKDLLKDHFLLSDEDKESTTQDSPSTSHNADGGGNQLDACRTSEEFVPDGLRDVMLQGQRKDLHTIFLKLRIPDSAAPGFFRNIHFPFDVDVDTPIAVATEMVEELDLTDQDISIIADMIEAEIRIYIPKFSPKKFLGDQVGDEAAISDCSASEAMGNASPMTSESACTGPYVLERLPSGRKFWCTSPKAGDNGSPIRPGPSNLSLVDSLTPGDNWTEENGLERALNGCKEMCNLSGIASNSQLENEYMLDDSVEDEDANGSSLRSDDLCSGNGSYTLEEDDSILRNFDSDDIKTIEGKIEHLLIEQQRELDELKMKHELAVQDLLKELNPEVCRIVLSICNLKISGNKSAI